MQDMAVPPSILTHVRASVSRIFGSRGDEAVAEALARVPTHLPLAQVRRLIDGGPYGWLVDARLDEIDGRLVLEVLEDSRMAGPSHYAIDADGTVRSLPTPLTGYGWHPDDGPEAKARAEKEYHAHNREVGEQLRSRGF